MAVLDISEYNILAADQNTRFVLTGQEPNIANQQVSISASSAQSAAFSSVTRFVRVHTDVTCRIAFGDNPIASATTKRMAANSTEYFGVYPGHKIAVITSS